MGFRHSVSLIHNLATGTELNDRLRSFDSWGTWTHPFCTSPGTWNGVSLYGIRYLRDLALGLLLELKATTYFALPSPYENMAIVLND